MLITLFFITLIFFMVLAMFIGAPLVFSSQKTAEKMIELLDIKPGEIVYDLGSGDGRLLVLSAKKGVKAIGIEINPYAVLLSWFRVVLSGVRNNVRIKWNNFWWVDFSEADKVVVFGIPWMMKRLAKKLKKELKPGTLIVSNSFQVPGLKMIKNAQVGKDHIYLYKT